MGREGDHVGEGAFEASEVQRGTGKLEIAEFSKDAGFAAEEAIKAAGR